MPAKIHTGPAAKTTPIGRKRPQVSASAPRVEDSALTSSALCVECPSVGTMQAPFVPVNWLRPFSRWAE